MVDRASQQSEMIIYVKPMTGQTFTIKVGDLTKTTIAMIKQDINRQQPSIKPKKMVLSLNNQVLNDNETLASRQITHEMSGEITFHLIVKNKSDCSLQ